MNDLQRKKQKMREVFRQRRHALNAAEKAIQDQKIIRHLLGSPLYREHDVLLVYVSAGAEIDIYALIEQAFRDGKKVAAPVCLSENGDMAFYYIHALTDLRPSFFSIPAPDPKTSQPYDNAPALCLVPGLGYDQKGFRLGYGRGYYDRFLSHFTGVSAGLCYEMNLVDELIAEATDIPVHAVFTEQGVYQIDE